MGNNYIIEDIWELGIEKVHTELRGKVAKLNLIEGVGFEIDEIQFGKLLMGQKLKCGLTEVITQSHMVYLREVEI
ncbi:MAG: hypothetical protein ACRDD7_15620 [Peptostreptococcaceae bacterium]